MAGQTYIKELDGTVSITYVFGNPEGWKDFAAYHIAEDGTKTLKEYTYNEGTGQVTIYSDHHSVYAMLEEPSGSGSGSCPQSPSCQQPARYPLEACESRRGE